MKRRSRRQAPHSRKHPPKNAAILMEALREARLNAGYTHGQLTKLAERSGVDRAQLWRYENGQAYWPDIYTLWKLADEYHCTLDELVGRRKTLLRNEWII